MTNDLNSFPLQLLSGNASGAYLVEDGPFGHAAGCRRQQQGTIELDGVPYATGGAFSVNLWFRADNVSGSDLQYIYSQANGRFASNGAGTDQVMHHHAPPLASPCCKRNASGSGEHILSLQS